MNNKQSTLSANFNSNLELNGFKEKTDQLMSNLENDDLASALQCITELNDISGKNFYSTIGKLTRGLHDAISDLSISSPESQPENNKTRVDLNYVISLTDNAAKKTLDMTENSMVRVNSLKKSSAEQVNLLESYLSTHSTDEETTELLQNLLGIAQQNITDASTLNSNITEIIMAQNFQDIASQSITKAIHTIKDVENSLVSLTQHANLLSTLSNFSDPGTDELNPEDSDAIKSNIGQMNKLNENEHLDQNDVDNLLSSLGF